VASEPARAWPAIVGRGHDLDVVNLGYAGAARGEVATAEQIARLPAEAITVAYGTNCWTRTPHSVEMMLAGFGAFLTVVRQGHPATPIVVVSPIVRPDAETSPNRLDATLADIRLAIEDTTRDHIAGGDEHLALVEGAKLVEPDRLPDGIHPGDQGHAQIAAAVGPELVAALAREG
jgi:lysophospholipase L1-like esterase